MSNKTLTLTDELYEYLLGVSLREDPILEALRAETSSLENANMQIAPEQGQFMAFLIKTIGAKKAIEVGVFTGYSALVVAQALPEDGRLVACDVNAEWPEIGRRYWRQANVDHKIDLRIRPALETLEALIEDGEGGTYDFAFIDADKTSYASYFEACLTLLTPGGLVAIDNVLWDGGVIDPSVTDENVEAIRALNRAMHGDERVDLSLLPIADGLTLARKRG